MKKSATTLNEKTNAHLLDNAKGMGRELMLSHETLDKVVDRILRP